MSDQESLLRRIERERSARKQAELLLEQKSRELYEINQDLQASRDELERRVAERTQQLAEAARNAEAANQSKSEFLANMSHEIRTPMTAILGYSELLLNDRNDISLGQIGIDAVQTIKRNGEHLLGIINDLLDLSKIEAGKLEPELRPCSLRGIAEDVCQLMQVRADAKGILLQLKLEATIPEKVLTDGPRLRQILVNLVGNSIKFTEQGSVQLIVRASSSRRERIEFEVVDTGIGMTLEQQERLFQPFTQADSSMSRKFGGTGLGLTISKRLSEILGGGLSILDSKPNVGTRFEAWISATEVVVSRLEDQVLSPSASKVGSDGLQENTFVNSSTSSGESTVPLRLDGLRILLAEDGLDNQRLISYVLKKAGGNVTVAENGRVAIEATQTAKALGQPFDIILMDMQMPVFDGYQSATELRIDGYGGVIIALTAHAMSGDREKCVAAGCNDYATKPINRSELIFMIASYCQDKISSSN